MIRWIESISDCDETVPAVLIVNGAGAEERRALLPNLVARCTGLQPNEIVIEQVEGRPPVVTRPADLGLHLSLAKRGQCTALAIAVSPVGVDVEFADTQGEIPWNVLHAREAAHLAALPGEARVGAFARLWSLKEAYLKALGIGLFREPSSFEVSILDQERATIRDELTTTLIAEARTTWRAVNGARAAISVVICKDRATAA